MTVRTMRAPDPGDSLLVEEALNNCASEPIHLVGSIQPIGVLLAVDRTGFAICAASANLASIFPFSAEAAIGKRLADLVGEEQSARLMALSEERVLPGPIISSLSLERDGRTRQYDAQVFATGNLLIMEVELAPRQTGDVFHDLFVPIRDALWKLDAENDIGRYAQAVIEQVRLLTGFDRVMMYRFDANWDGEVIAESKTEEAGSYLGHHFPGSDIPRQARDLYTRNLVRLIGDVKAAQVPLIQDASRQGQPIDLTASWLRSMSPVHVEYLQNMGVRASLSISLVQNNRLWGLIACHHFSPKQVSLRERELNELIGRTVSLKLMNMENLERSALNNRIRDLLYELTDLIRRTDDIDTVVQRVQEKLLGLVRASGVVVALGDTRHTAGEVPPEGTLDKLVATLRRRDIAPVFHTDQTGKVIESSNDPAQGADGLAGGMMVAPLDHRMDNYVMWFRPGLLRTVRWAGRPEKRVTRNASGVHISPRRSFDTWIETHRSKSLPWSQAEVDAANALSMALIESLSEKALKASEEHYRLLAENSTDMIASLDLEGRFRFVSPSSRELLGMDSATVVGKFLQDVLGEERQRLTRMLEELQPLGSAQTAVIRGPVQNGVSLWIEATLKHTLGSNGDDDLVMNARDVTQRYKYQLAIEEGHRRNARILDAAGEGLISLDERGCVTYANECALRVLGDDGNSVSGAYCCELLCSIEGDHSCHHDKDACPFLLTLRDGETRQGCHSLRETIGEKSVLVNYVCTPLIEREAIVGCVIVFTQIDGAAEDQEATTDIILDQAVEAVMVTAADGRITSVNRAFTEITGFSAEEAIGETPRILRSGVHTPHFYEEFWRLLRDEGRWTGEIWNRRKNGEVYPQWGSVTAIRDDSGNIKNFVTVFSDVSKAKQAEEKLYHLANHDVLTGLPNRMRFTDQLARTLERRRHGTQGVAVAFIDLDNFKIINDTLGHNIGDSYLKTVAERLTASTRKQDTLARWGGDEFILAMEDIGDREIIGESIKRLLGQLAKPLHLAGHELTPTASVGVALYPEDGALPVDIIKAADSAMYIAKKLGRNRFEFYTKSMSATLDHKLTLTGELRRAVEEGQFRLAYQPQVDPVTGATKGAEALIRWQHPSRGLLAPADFLALADELGLMDDLGAWILNEACRQMRAWQKAGVPIPRVAVNVAPSQLKDSFVALVAAAIRDAGIAPEQLEIEITEGALESGEAARNITTGLRNLGVLLSVDDFGTGYSSLSHLKMFPITCFKIDKSFIDGIPGSESDIAIVRTVLALGSSFKVEVIAEGVETAEQMEFLRAEGVKNIQGYYFARPMMPDMLLDWISRGKAA